MSSDSTATFVISLDFEMYWGVHDSKSLADYRAHLSGVRQVVPALLDLFERYELHATWATVGFLFCESRDELLELYPEVLPGYDDARFSPYHKLEHIGADEREDPYHFAPSLIESIAACPGQEIGSHTFSHYYCLEHGQNRTAFEADLHAAVKVARRRGYELKSIVFPRNQIRQDYLQSCGKAGFTAYRGNPNSSYHQGRRQSAQTLLQRGMRLADAYLPLHRKLTVESTRHSMVDVPASRFLRPYSERSRYLSALRLRRITGEMRRAAQQKTTYHLWWHPHNFGADLGENLAFLEKVARYYQRMHSEYGMESLTMLETAEKYTDAKLRSKEVHEF